MRLKRKRKKNHSHFHLAALGYASASRTHAAVSRPDWAWSPRRESRPCQNAASSTPEIKPAAPAESTILVAVPPAPRPSVNASAADARIRGCTRVNTWLAS